MSRLFHTICFIFITLVVLSGQNRGISPVNNGTSSAKAKVRAVVVGISDYQNNNITDLQYAHEDAKAFAGYLLDPMGMNVDSSNVRLLINEKATAGQFVSALYGLMEESKEGDLVVIYFSGHGDVESTTINQPGFLLFWDAPSKVYMAGGTFGLTYLQEIIATLSLNAKSKVLVIADACRAGKLAGSAIGGSNATAANLAKQYANEIKIMSCQPDEFSLEGKSWGNGRGVFSYYFLAGLQGLADKNNDMIVSLGEIERFLDDKVPAAVAPHSQIPMTTGNKNTPLATVNKETLKKLKSTSLEGGLSTTDTKGVHDYFTYIDTNFQKILHDFDEALISGHLISPKDRCAWDKLQEIIRHPESAKVLGILKRNLAAALQDETQQVINAYLRAEQKELASRWSFDEKYQKYPDQLIKAAELLGDQHFFYKTIMSRYHYFMGLNYRLRGEQSKNSDSLYHLAIEQQTYSLHYLDDTPHVFNELGWTYHLLKSHDSSVYYLQKAIQFAPEWALPWTNLCIRYNKQKDFTNAVNAGTRAWEADSNFVHNYTVLAETFIEMKDHNKARQWLFDALQLDSISTKAMEYLGYSYSKTNQYAESAKWYQKMIETDSTKVNTISLNSLGYVLLLSGKRQEAFDAYSKAKSLTPVTEYSYQGMIEYYYYTKDMVHAEKELKEYVLKFPSDNYAHFLLASICAGSAREDESYNYLQMAFTKGFNNLEALHQDENLKSLTRKQRFKSLIQKYIK
jgi:cytochrome c-type biogenesis protein CcmH/NrfG/uncharacterized caspase-like protein